jgi:hypothetical protein
VLLGELETFELSLLLRVQYVLTYVRTYSADEIDEKTGDSVAEILKSQHPMANIPDVRHLPTYTERPVLTDVDVTPDVVDHVARHLSGRLV